MKLEQEFGRIFAVVSDTPEELHEKGEGMSSKNSPEDTIWIPSKEKL